MARDFEDIHSIENLGDDELRELVRDHLRAHNLVDVDDINVHVEKGRVRLLGRVGTEAQLRVAEHVLTDQLGLQDVSNELMVDPIRRAVSPEDIDEHLNDEDRAEGLLLGDRAVPLSPEAELQQEDLDARLVGTTDVGKSIAEGTAWIPPESPTPEGLGGSDATPGSMGEDH